MEVQENQPVGTLVGTVVAEDLDPINKAFVYNIDQNQTSAVAVSNFSLDSVTGEIKR